MDLSKKEESGRESKQASKKKRGNPKENWNMPAMKEITFFT